MRELLLSGDGFEPGQTWKFFRADSEPEYELCTAVGVVIFTDPEFEQLVLIRNIRGVEPVAGHIESGESPLDAVRREAQEEAGAALEAVSLFGYTEIHADGGTLNDSKYPVLSYIPIYWSVFQGELLQPTGEDVFDRKIVASTDVVSGISIEGFSDRNRRLISLVINSVSGELQTR